MRVLSVCSVMVFSVLAGAAFAAERSADALRKAMAADERLYYAESFDYAMLNLEANQRHEWKSYRSSGSFTAGMPYPGSQTVCRKYREILTVAGMYSMSTDGIACARVGRDGWCRLAEGDALTCALEPPDNELEQKLRDARDAVTQGQNKGSRAKNAFWDWWPF